MKLHNITAYQSFVIGISFVVENSEYSIPKASKKITWLSGKYNRLIEVLTTFSSFWILQKFSFFHKTINQYSLPENSANDFFTDGIYHR